MTIGRRAILEPSQKDSCSKATSNSFGGNFLIRRTRDESAFEALVPARLQDIHDHDCRRYEWNPSVNVFMNV
ncbi:MAG: hypothetical protein WBW32_07350 [Luteibacter sp.]